MSIKKESQFADPDLEASYQRALKAIMQAGIDLRYERHARKH